MFLCLAEWTQHRQWTYCQGSSIWRNWWVSWILSNRCYVKVCKKKKKLKFKKIFFQIQSGQWNIIPDHSGTVSFIFVFNQSTCIHMWLFLISLVVQESQENPFLLGISPLFKQLQVEFHKFLVIKLTWNMVWYCWLTLHLLVHKIFSQQNRRLQ